MSDETMQVINDPDYGKVTCQASMIKAIEFDQGSGSVLVDLSDQGLPQMTVLIVNIDSISMSLLAAFLPLGFNISFKTEKATPDKFNGSYYILQHLGGIRTI